MPYLPEDFKHEIEQSEGLDFQKAYGASLKLKDFLGYLNYKNFVLIKAWIAKNGKSYFALAGIIGTLICCVLEVYRRVVAPYEDTKIKDNGDV